MRAKPETATQDSLFTRFTTEVHLRTETAPHESLHSNTDETSDSTPYLRP
jgi:hypothetical protein